MRENRNDYNTNNHVRKATLKPAHTLTTFLLRTLNFVLFVTVLLIHYKGKFIFLQSHSRMIISNKIISELTDTSTFFPLLQICKLLLFSHSSINHYNTKFSFAIIHFSYLPFGWFFFFTYFFDYSAATFPPWPLFPQFSAVAHPCYSTI